MLLGQLGTEAPTWRFVLYPIALLLLMLLRPKGLLGSVEWGFLKTVVVPVRKHEPVKADSRSVDSGEKIGVDQSG